MFIPYSYQRRCRTTLHTVRREGKKRALVVMASGLGKTVAAGFDVHDFLRALPSARVLYLCHQNSILEKGRETFEEIIGGELTDYGFYHGLKKERSAKILFASFQTMTEHYREFKRKEFDYIVVDESHHSQADTYLLVLAYFLPEFLLGITATPDRTDLLDIRLIFGEEVFSLNLAEALAKGYLTPVDYRLITDPVVDLGKIENPYRLSMKELNRTIFVPRRDDEIVRIIHEKAAGIKNPRMIVFCKSIGHAERFAKHLKGSLPVHSGLPQHEQDRRVKAFREGRATALVTVDKFNEGVDIPEVNIIVFLRATESRTVFYQQLGRGLRRAKGKKKVLALDFVGNCERIRLIESLKREIRQYTEVDEYIGRGAVTATVFDFGSFTFTEQARDVLAVLDKVGQAYSKQDLIAQLQTEGERLGRTPGIREINQSSKAGRTVSSTTFSRAFGSWNNALRAAGFRALSIKGYSREELIAQLQSEAKRLGRTPRSLDIQHSSTAKRTAAPLTFRNFFGSFDDALKAAGFIIDPMKDHSRKTLVAQLKQEAKRLGRTPSTPDINASSKARRTVSVETFKKVFGSWEGALNAAGFEANVIRRDHSNLIAELRKEARRLKRNPTSLDINLSSQAGRTASTTTFLRAFGSWGDVLKAAGLEANKDYDRKTLVAQLKQEAKLLGRTPTTGDIITSSKAGRTASTATFRTFFGSWGKTLKAAGFNVHRVRRDRVALIAQLKKEAKRLGRSPDMADIEILSKEGEAANVSTFLKEFGSWTKALVAAGLRLNAIQRYSKEVLIAKLKQEAKRLGQTPTSPQIDVMSRQGKMPASVTFAHAFGSWSKALVAAGFKPNAKRYTKDLLIAQLKQEAKRLGRSPHAKDLGVASKAGRTASPSMFSHAFGTHNGALKAAGLEVNKK